MNDKKELSKIQRAKRVTNFSVSMKALGRRFGFYTEHLFDGKVNRKEVLKKEDLYKDPEGLFKIFSSEELQKDALAALKESAVPVFGVRHLFVGKKLAKAVKEEGVENVIYIGVGKDFRHLQKTGDNSLRPNQDPKYKEVNYYLLDIKDIIDEVTNIFTQNPDIKQNPRSHYIEIKDFDGKNIINGLENAKIDFSKKTLVIMEGVTFYLTKEAVIDILLKIKERFTNTVSVVFDYQKSFQPVNEKSIESGKEAVKNLTKEEEDKPRFNFYQDINAELLSKIPGYKHEHTNLSKLIVEYGLGDKVLPVRESCNFMKLST